MGVSHLTRKNKKCTFEIGIPSYQRAETLRDKTLHLLERYKINPKCITVFVANNDELVKYKDILKPNTYGKLVVGFKGVMEIRNFIVGYYAKGTKVVCIDDDIRDFIEYDATEKRHEKPLKNLLKIIERGFSECDKNDATLWGVYPVANGFFMKPKVTTDLRFVVGSFFGFINQGLDKIRLTTGSKDDYERTILHYLLDGKVIRLNFVSPKTAYYKEPGGMQQDGRLEREETAVKHLLKKYPELVHRTKSRSTGFPEIRLADKRDAGL
jgi:hypothetical protein